jgi:hypothetical protein
MYLDTTYISTSNKATKVAVLENQQSYWPKTYMYH